MFKRFSQYFTPDSERNRGVAHTLPTTDLVPELSELFANFGGQSFSQGLYRVMRPSTLEQWDAMVADAFPHFRGNVLCFGYDWLGRVFAVNAHPLETGLRSITMFEPGTGEALEIPCDLIGFHNEELVDQGDAALAASFHAQWLGAGGLIPAFDQCIGYKQPLFLGGKDTLANLELADARVYWSLSAQLIRKAKGLPPGTRVKIEKSGP
jgi:hypothetical protein